MFQNSDPGQYLGDWNLIIGEKGSTEISEITLLEVQTVTYPTFPPVRTTFLIGQGKWFCHEVQEFVGNIQ